MGFRVDDLLGRILVGFIHQRNHVVIIRKIAAKRSSQSVHFGVFLHPITANLMLGYILAVSKYSGESHVLCVDTGRSSETAKAHRG
eukprot:TRINITY_DN6290_c0_g1_i1.p1 TRINITY_DN6290_c0_g1~~TRINITY_DN6290_c0_g1_i1.p1  ORF type:complete len:86 (+),score=15.29 TRINITY_DN6290_c0_g1_i1:194-451(+)